jgi:hypothetical protein
MTTTKKAAVRRGFKLAVAHRAIKVRRHHTACKVGSRLVKLECPGCGYVLRATRVWIATGVPVCVCGARFEVVLGKVSMV